MTSLIINKTFSEENQSGVTLMLAVLILASLTAIIFSMAAIVTLEVKTAGDSSRSEPALYATLGYTEEALMKFRRGVGTEFDIENCQPAQYVVCNLSGVAISPQILQFEENPQVINIRAGEKIVIPLYEAQNFDQQYSEISFTAIQNGSGGAISAQINKIDRNSFEQIVASLSLSEFTGNTQVFQQFTSGSQYEVILDNRLATKPISLSIYTEDPAGQPKGIPFIGQKVLKIVTEYLGLTRTYVVKIPQ